MARAARGLASSNQGRSGKAAQVLASTIGLSTGAANKKPKAVAIGAPEAISRRATGTLPHSQAGRAKPRAAPVSGPNRGSAGKRRSQPPAGLNQRTREAMPTPINRNGSAPINSPWKTAQVVASLSQPIACLHLPARDTHINQPLALHRIGE